jgi:hypothetical protein
MGIIWFIVSNALAAAISVSIGRLWLGHAPVLPRILGMLALFPVIAVATIIVTGTAGALNIVWVVAALTVVALVLAGLPGVRRALIHKDAASPPAPAESRPASALDSVALALTILMLCTTCLSCFLLGTAFDRNFPDDFTYHCPSIAQWIVHQAIVPPFHYHAYFPYNAEAFAAWFILPVHADALAGIAGAYWLVLLWLAALCIALDLGIERAWGMIGASVITCTPMVSMMAPRFSSPDLAGVSMTLAGVAFLLPSSVDPNGKSRGHAILAGLLLGFAIGCKVSFAPVLLAVLIWVCASSRVAPRLSDRLRLAAILVVSSIVTGSFWYVRNWIVAGNPLFPASFGPFAGPFSPADQAQTKLYAWILNRPTDLRQWWTIIHAIIDWPPTLFALAFLGYALTLYREIFTRTPDDRAPVFRLLFLVGLATFAAFFFLPFSATYDVPHGELKPALRYAILPFAIGIILFAGHPTKTPTGIAIKVAAFLLAVLPAWTTDPLSGLIWFPVMIVAMSASALSAKTKRFSRTVRFGFLGITVLGLGAALAIWYPFAKATTDNRVFFYDDADHPVGTAWKALEHTPQGSRIAWFTNRPQDYYPLFGRDLSRFPVALDPGGVPYKPWHTLFKESGGHLRWWWWWAPVRPSKATLARNIAQANVDYVWVSKWREESWPPQQAILAESEGCSVFFEDGYSTIWRIDPAPRAEAQLTRPSSIPGE